MKLQKTKLVSMMVFYPFAVISTIFTVRLFWDFAGDAISGILWGIVGFSMEFCKIYFLAKWTNSLYLKRKVRLMDPGLYFAFMLLSAVASCIFGISTIEKQSLRAESENSRLYEVGISLKDAEGKLKRIESGEADAEKRAIDKQIDALSDQIKNVSFGVAERSVAITGEIERLQNRRRELGRTGDDEKRAIIKAIGEQRREYSTLAQVTMRTKGSFETLSQTLGVGQNTVMVIFLFFVVFAIEIGMASTSGPAVAGAMGAIGAVEPKKKANRDQIMLPGVVERKGKKK